MKVAIDAAGRLVVPKALRQELGVISATELEIVAIDGRLELSAPDLAARVETRDGFPVFATDGAEVPVLTADAVRTSIERGRR